ncbi:hypothetical protein ILYODFUR_035059 [Ilyodon furcidens]|uniref:Uncharacterized protein n=1 Tax=Ilyodon furcidens TaxID=33524 RepID=A0ABV0UXR9_9TELE
MKQERCFYLDSDVTGSPQLPRFLAVPEIEMEFKRKFRMKDSPSPSPLSSDSSVRLPALQSASCPPDSSSNHLPMPCF